MSPSAQRIAIAEARGWRPDESHHGVKGEWDVVKWFALKPMVGGGAWQCDVRVPDYLNDLNAMHEAEKVLTPGKQSDYAIALFRITGAPFVADRTWHEISCATRATAAQRAEALLRTLNLWDDSK